MSFVERALKDISIRITKGTTPTTMGRPFVDVGINYIKAEALNGDPCLSEQGFAQIDEQTHEMLARSKLRQDDVLVTIAGANIGKVGIVQEKHLPANTNQAVGIVRVDKNMAHPRYVYYFFKQKSTFDYIQNLNGQAAQPNLNLNLLGEIRVPFPSLSQQVQTANGIAAYDDLIENNLRRIQLLENAARLIYKEWFVKLNFPGREHTKIVDGVPEGWTHGTLNDIAFEYRENVQYDPNFADMPYIGLEHIPRKSLTLAEWGRFEDAQSTKHKFEKFDILFGKIRAYFHKVGFAITGGVSSADSIVIRPHKKNLYSYVLFSVSSDEFISFATQVGVGAKMPRSNWNVLEKYELLIPPHKLLELFNEEFEPIQQQLTCLATANKKLREARDLLLPKLMSGEIAV